MGLGYRNVLFSKIFCLKVALIFFYFYFFWIAESQQDLNQCLNLESLFLHLTLTMLGVTNWLLPHLQELKVNLDFTYLGLHQCLLPLERHYKPKHTYNGWQKTHVSDQSLYFNPLVFLSQRSLI